jgi:hypothetical protein
MKSPGTEDYGVWYFPRTSHSARPAEYTVKNLLSAIAVTAGPITEAVAAGLPFSPDTVLALNSALEVCRDLLSDRSVNPLLFWDEYVLARWHIDLRCLNGNGATEPWKTVTQARVIAKRMEEQISALADSKFNHPLMQFRSEEGCLAGTCSSTNEFLAEMFRRLVEGGTDRSVDTFLRTDNPRFFLESAQQHLRQRCYDYLKSAENEETQSLRRGLWQSANRLLELGRKALSTQATPQELRDSYHSFLPALVDLIDAEANPGVAPGKTRALLPQLADSVVQNASERQDSRLTELLNVFAHRLAERSSQASEPADYCRYHLESLVCPSCRQEETHLIWDIINTYVRQDLKELVESGPVPEPRCHHCGLGMRVTPQLVYWSPRDNLYLTFASDLGAAGEKTLHESLVAYFESLPPEYKAGRRHLGTVTKHVLGWKGAEDYLLVSRVTELTEFSRIIGGRFRPPDEQQGAGASDRPDGESAPAFSIQATVHVKNDAPPPATGLGSPAHPLADADGESRRNIARCAARKQWLALPWWRRLFTRCPTTVEDT